MLVKQLLKKTGDKIFARAEDRFINLADELRVNPDTCGPARPRLRLVLNRPFA